jgi:hypothetical protein
LRLSSPHIASSDKPDPPASATTRLWTATPEVVAYYELDLAGNVRRLREPGGNDLGGYRYTAFGDTLEDTVQRGSSLASIDNRKRTRCGV